MNRTTRLAALLLLWAPLATAQSDPQARLQQVHAQTRAQAAEMADLSEQLAPVAGLLGAPPPAAAAPAQAAPLPLAMAPPSLLDARGDAGDISLALRDADVREALRMVARQGEVDIVMSSSVEGPITLELEHATLRQTLDAIMSVSGFEYADDGSIITVSTLQEQLDQQRLRDAAAGDPSLIPVVLDFELFKLRYVDAARVESIVQPLLSEHGSVALLKTTDHIVQDSGTGDGAMADLQIGGRLSSSSQGQPARSHTLVVSDLPERLARIAELVAEVDVRPAQVQIEARFVEVALGKEDRLGIDWNVAVRAAGAATPHTAPFGWTSLGQANPFVSGGSPIDIFPQAPNSVSTPGNPGLFTFGTLDFTTFTALLELIDDDQRVQIVSNPRVLVQDRTTATILVGERFPILSTTVTDEGTVTEELERYEPIGVQLEVTPSILGDDEVELFARPSTSTLGPLVEGSTGIQVARINTRQVDTSVTALDGQTIVLGGLVSSRQADVVRRVPWLSAIPLLGALFTYEATETERVDLMVFLTVRIVRDSGLTPEEQELFEATTFQRAGTDEDAEPWWTPLDFSQPIPEY